MIMPAESLPLDHYSQDELRTLKSRINTLLPQDSLEELDLTLELFNTFREAQTMLKDEKEAPLNQRAQTINSLTSILKQLAELQRAHFSAARLQAFEKTLATLFTAHPEIPLLEEYTALIATPSTSPQQ